MRHLTVTSCLVVVLALLLAAPGGAAAAKNAKKKAEQAALDEKTAAIMEKACASLAALGGFSFVADITLDRVHEDGSKIQIGRRMEVKAQRPGSFSIATVGDDIAVNSVFDGKAFSLSLPQRQIYGQLDAAMDTDRLMDLLAEKYGIESPLGDFLSNEPCAKLSNAQGYYIGKARVGGVLCDHLFFEGHDADWQLWIEDSPAALPRKIVITEKRQRSSPQFSATFSQWKPGTFPPGTFAFAPPAGFTRDDAVITGAAASSKPKGKEAP